MVNHINFSESGLAEMQEMFKRAQVPPVKLIARLDGELMKTFGATQAHTHIISGALKASGKATSEIRPGAWVGTISYGGPSTPHFVNYAIYEQARGGDHDFMWPAYASQPNFEAIMAEKRWTSWWK